MCMNRATLISQIKAKRSFLCVGLDTDIDRIPKHLLKEEDPIFAFNKAIIDATKDYCIAYKPNVAFYESQGTKGWEALEKTAAYIPDDKFTIADAKRGDIGNTSAYYAKTFFERMNFDAVTIAPYMGEDSITPFLEYKDKWVIVLALTSNKGALDFQFMTDMNGEKLYERVLRTTAKWGSPENLMYVVGATRAESIKTVRKNVPSHFFLVPGIGAQGGSLKDTAEYGWIDDSCGVIVNASRSILYASDGKDFAEAASKKAHEIQTEMSDILEMKGFD